MGRFTAFILGRLRAWDPRSRLGIIIALLLIIPALITAAAGPENLRTPATIAVMGLVIVTQLIIMWENRGMVTEYTRAQRHYRRGDFAAVRDLLEKRRASGKADVNELTLLGNAYRQIGQLDTSAQVLSEALNIRPDHYFPRYGFGRTLIAQGEYDRAVEMIESALAQGAPPVVQFDLGEALYRAGQAERATAMLREAQAIPNAEPYRALMTAYLLARLDAAPQAAVAQVGDIDLGLAYWQAQAERFGTTRYGDDLAADLQYMRHIAEER
ncbi:MAG: tetratricopeptide repeat protein [Chloroflexota bacterium]